MKCSRWLGSALILAGLLACDAGADPLTLREGDGGSSDARLDGGTSATRDATAESLDARASDGATPTGRSDAGALVPAPTCAASPAGGTSRASAPQLVQKLADRYHEGWLASPAVADLDGDGRNEIVLARHGKLLTFDAAGRLAWSFEVPKGGRIWASPVIADLTGDGALEVAFAARESVYVLDARGAVLSGYPRAFRDELRALAAGDLDGDGRLELVTLTTTPLPPVDGSPRDILLALEGDGSVVAGFPPNTTGHSGCDMNCFVTGGYDQNLAVGPIDGDARWDILAAQDNAYLSWHHGDGVAFEAASIFRSRKKVLGVRFLHDYPLAQQGYADDESTANQAHFTNTAPAIADLDGDGQSELVFTGSVQNAAQSDRLRGVALWVLRPDATRPPGWELPHHVLGYRAGLWDFEGTNIVGLTNQVSIADIDAASPGLEVAFAGFDGAIHIVNARNEKRASFTYTEADDVLTAGIALADLSSDGVPELVFATYSPRMDASALFIVGADGALQQRVPLPRRGAMSVPTVADVDGDGTLELVVDLKDAADRQESGLVYNMPGSHSGCVPWPTGRANLLRNGYVAHGSP